MVSTKNLKRKPYARPYQKPPRNKIAERQWPIDEYECSSSDNYYACRDGCRIHWLPLHNRRWFAFAGLSCFEPTFHNLVSLILDFGLVICRRPAASILS